MTTAFTFATVQVQLLTSVDVPFSKVGNNLQSNKPRYRFEDNLGETEWSAHGQYRALRCHLQRKPGIWNCSWQIHFSSFRSTGRLNAVVITHSVAVLFVEFAFRGRILCFCGTVDLVVLNLKSDRSKFCKLWFWRNHGYKNQALPFGVDWQPQTRQEPQSYDTCFYIQPKIT